MILYLNKMNNEVYSKFESTIAEGLLHLNKITEQLDVELLPEHTSIIRSFQELSSFLEQTNFRLISKWSGQSSFERRNQFRERPKQLSLGVPTIEYTSTAHTNTKELHFTLTNNEQEIGTFYCNLIGKTIILQKELGGSAQYVMYINDFDIKRVNKQTVSLTSLDASFEFIFKTEQDCHKLYSSILDKVPQNVELDYSLESTLSIILSPNSESFCAYDIIKPKINRTKSCDELELEHTYQSVLSPHYYYPLTRAATEDASDHKKHSRSNRGIRFNTYSLLKSLSKFKPNSISSTRKVNKDKQQTIASPVYNYISIFPF